MFSGILKLGFSLKVKTYNAQVDVWLLAFHTFAGMQPAYAGRRKH
jgi:hypothetical protein